MRMPYDRPRRRGEDIVRYAVETQRIAASAADDWRTILRGGGVPESFVEGLATPLLPDPQVPKLRPQVKPQKAAQPVAASAPRDAVSPAGRASMCTSLGLPATASAAEVYAALEARVSAKKTPAPVAAAGPAPQRAAAPPLVDANANPAVADLAGRFPQVYRDAFAASGGAVPGLFGSADLPAVTASGIAPQQLAAAHWGARHAIADAPDPAEAQRLLELASGPDADAMVSGLPEFAGHPGNRAYLTEVQVWAARGDAVMRQRQEAAQVAAARQQQIAASAAAPDTAEAAYDALFGPLEDREIAYAEDFDRSARNASSVMAMPNTRVVAGRRLKAEREGRQQ
jgi:hypothetical protein